MKKGASRKCIWRGDHVMQSNAKNIQINKFYTLYIKCTLKYFVLF